jgi:hypothetical protein
MHDALDAIVLRVDQVIDEFVEEKLVPEERDHA